MKAQNKLIFPIKLNPNELNYLAAKHAKNMQSDFKAIICIRANTY